MNRDMKLRNYAFAYHLLHPNRAGILQKTLRGKVLLKISLWQYNCRQCLMEMGNDTHEFVLQSMPQRTTGKIKALIIEDETDIRYLVSNILKQKGVQSVLAGSLSEAEKIFQQNLPPPRII